MPGGKGEGKGVGYREGCCNGGGGRGGRGRG